MPNMWVEPEEFLHHNDVTVYYAYKDGELNHRMTSHFTTDINEIRGTSSISATLALSLKAKSLGMLSKPYPITLLKRGKAHLPCPRIKKEEFALAIHKTIRRDLAKTRRQREHYKKLHAIALHAYRKERMDVKELASTVTELEAELAFYILSHAGPPTIIH